jgi:pimeloyl-ACP methyl ester carboxylesterase
MSPGSSPGHIGMATAELANVQRWYDTRGQGDPLVALHPGGTGVDSPALHPNVEALSQHFQVYAPEQLGHRHTPDVEGPITFELMAQDTIMFIETVIGRPVHVLGCSDGAILALTVTLRRPTWCAVSCSPPGSPTTT